ncbi:phage tail assembly chaperone [Listeria monocytogenes]
MAQNNVIHIELEKSYQEFQLGKEMFKVFLGDEMRRNWIEADEMYKKKLEKLNKYNIDEEMSSDDYYAVEEEVAEALTLAYALLLNDEKAYQKCYVQCEDMIKMYTTYDQVVDVLVGSVEKQQNEIQKNYKAKMTKKAK